MLRVEDSRAVTIDSGLESLIHCARFTGVVRYMIEPSSQSFCVVACAPRGVNFFLATRRTISVLRDSRAERAPL